ncbi:UNVERIFIED_CONTAM: hypothetical protein K2H54_018707 [Gekko kuhli]
MANLQNLPAMFEYLELQLGDKISQAINPIREQLQDIQASLRITSQTAETALKIGTTLKTDMADLHIPQEALAIRYRLKPTTAKLQSANITYKWLPSDTLQMFYQGRSYYARDEDSSLKILQNFNRTEDLDLRRSQKRKHNSSTTPEKITKILIWSGATPEPEDIADCQPDA